MRSTHAIRPRAWMVTLATLCTCLLLSIALVPTLMASVEEADTVTVPVANEEEQPHGRDVHKVGALPGQTWSGATLMMGQRLRAAFRDLDVALPNGPISDVPHQPPKVAC